MIYEQATMVVVVMMMMMRVMMMMMVVVVMMVMIMMMMTLCSFGKLHSFLKLCEPKKYILKCLNLQRNVLDVYIKEL